MVLDNSGDTAATYRKVCRGLFTPYHKQHASTKLLTLTAWKVPIAGPAGLLCALGKQSGLSHAGAALQVHLFDVDVPNGPVLMESRTTAPGDKVSGAAELLSLVRLAAAM